MIALTAALAVATISLAASTAWLLLSTDAASSSSAMVGTIRFPMLPPPGMRFGSSIPRLETTIMALSPDGSAVAFVATPRVGGPSEAWIRRLDDDRARVVAGTEGALSVFWSPDGRELGFFAAGQLRRVDVYGGAPLKVCDVPRGVGVSGTWSSAGDILFAAIEGGAVYRVPAAGGTPVVTVASEGNERVLYPRFLPDGRQFIYTSLRNDMRGTIMLDRGDGPRVPLVEAASLGAWVEPDWLLFVREGTLVAQRIDVGSAQATGEPVAILPSVGYAIITAWASFSASTNGNLVAQTAYDESRVAWFGRDGLEAGTVGTPSAYFTLRLSHDGSSLLFSRMAPELGTYDIWTADLQRRTETRVTSSPGMETGETWAPDARSIIFSAGQGGPPNLFSKDLRTGVEQRLSTSGLFQLPDDVSPDGAWLAYRERNIDGDWDTFVLRLDEAREREPLFTTAASEAQTQFSPDGRRIAFVSSESAVAQVYLSPFPVDGSKTAVSLGGGVSPRWRADGSELFFISADGQLMVAPIDADGAPAEPRPLFSARDWTGYDVAPGGERFVAVVSQVNERDQPLSVIVNWPVAAPR